MRNNVNPIPEGYHTITPYLIVTDAAAAIEFYKKAFFADEIMRFTDANGKLVHAEIRIGSSPLMLADESIKMGIKSPQSLGGSPVFIHLYVEEVDRFIQNAIKAGAKEVKPIQDQFFGDRSGAVADPFSYVWNIASQIEVVSIEEMKRRAQEMMKK